MSGGDGGGEGGGDVSGAASAAAGGWGTGMGGEFGSGPSGGTGVSGAASAAAGGWGTGMGGEFGGAPSGAGSSGGGFGEPGYGGAFNSNVQPGIPNYPSAPAPVAAAPAPFKHPSFEPQGVVRPEVARNPLLNVGQSPMGLNNDEWNSVLQQIYGGGA